jgi:hypothetical protein
MDLTAQDAFKLGFLARCAEERLTGASLDARLEKVAEWTTKAGQIVSFNPFSGNNLITKGVETLGAGGKMLLAAPYAAAIVGGSGVGYGLGKMVEPQLNDDEIKSQELAATYKLYADKARARRKARKYRSGQHSEY